MSEAMGHTDLPWELVEATEHHGPYITSQWGTSLCDLYAMSNPSALSVRNGGDSRPIPFVDANANAAYIVQACNAFPDLVKALEDERQHLVDLIDAEWRVPNLNARIDKIDAALSAARAPASDGRG